MSVTTKSKKVAEHLAERESQQAETQARTLASAWTEYRSLLQRSVAGDERESDGELLLRLSDELSLTAALVERDTQLVRDYTENERRAAELPRLRVEHQHAHESWLQAKADAVAMVSDGQRQVSVANLAVASAEHARTEAALIRRNRPELFT